MSRLFWELKLDSGDFDFDGNMHPLMGPNSTKRKSVGIKFPAGGKIIFEVNHIEYAVSY